MHPSIIHHLSIGCLVKFPASIQSSNPPRLFLFPSLHQLSSPFLLLHTFHTPLYLTHTFILSDFASASPIIVIFSPLHFVFPFLTVTTLKIINRRRRRRRAAALDANLVRDGRCDVFTASVRHSADQQPPFHQNKPRSTGARLREHSLHSLPCPARIISPLIHPLHTQSRLFATNFFYLLLRRPSGTDIRLTQPVTSPHPNHHPRQPSSLNPSTSQPRRSPSFRKNIPIQQHHSSPVGPLTITHSFAIATDGPIGTDTTGPQYLIGNTYHRHYQHHPITFTHPYKALNVARDADQALIKSTYRKLVLKCHPDKVTDESLKAQKQEEFHKIQQAWEVIGDEAQRERYDDAVKLDNLQREKLARNRGAADARPAARYETRTQAPAGSHHYDDHKPSSRSYDDRSDRYYEERPRKYDTYEAYPKHTSPRSSREKDIPIKVTRVSTDRTRADYRKTRDREERRDRDRRFVSVDSDSSVDEKAHYEAEYRRRTEEARRARDAEDIRRAAADARRKAEDRRSYEESRYDRYDRHEKHDRSHKHKEWEGKAFDYIERSKVELDRPSPSRTTSSRDVRPEQYPERSRRDVRRSAARPRDRVTSTSGRDRDRKGIEIVDWEEERRMPSFKQSSSSPAEIHIPSRVAPQRAYTETAREHRRETSPPTLRRYDTMPSHSSSRRKEATPIRSSGLRESATPSSTAYAAAPTSSPSTTRKLYSYTPAQGVREEVNGHRTVLHEPSRFRGRSPSPLSRPPIGPNRPVEVAPNYASTSSKATKPSLPRAATMHVGPTHTEERGRRLFGESIPDSARRENARRQTSFSPDQVSYSSKYGPEDIRWAPRSREPPTLSRHSTSVY
ncbi:unnamed protein product [Periconia digitata]|uniref:J domain-containing protein n=1 Tax=Periconia digitata TaxID=1303443 RepID=A0A9W4UF74_9PLEO|nr:unnamed protein product [Periconia digitata]